MLSRANVVAGDGGAPPSDVRYPVRRVATGICLLVVNSEGSITDLALGIFPVPYKQTVPRAELNAPIVLGDLGYTGLLFSDASYVVKGSQKEATEHWKLIASSNGDMWQRYLDHPLIIHKVKAHRTLQCALRDGDFHAFVANAFADAAATQGVQLYRDRGAEERLDREMKDAKTSFRRVLAIEHARYLSQPKEVPLPDYPPHSDSS